MNWLAARVERFLRKAPEGAQLPAKRARTSDAATVSEPTISPRPTPHLVSVAAPAVAVPSPECASDVSPTLHYAVGDIHGMRAELDRLLTMIEADAERVGQSATVVFLGDLINRGPASRQVLDRLIEGPRRADDRWIALRGNHDQLFIDAIAGRSEAAFEQLLRKGGLETLASYGLRRKEASLSRARRAVPSHHLRFLESLPLTHSAGDFFFVHAGVDPSRPLESQSEKALMTIREPFLRNAHLLPFTVVHGHVANMKGPVVATKRICVDTGAYATGVLTAVALCGGAPARFLSTARS